MITVNEFPPGSGAEQGDGKPKAIVIGSPPPQHSIEGDPLRAGLKAAYFILIKMETTAEVTRQLDAIEQAIRILNGPIPYPP